MDREQIMDTRPGKGSGVTEEFTDITGEVPEVDDALETIDAALSRSRKQSWGRMQGIRLERGNCAC